MASMKTQTPCTLWAKAKAPLKRGLNTACAALRVATGVAAL